MTITYSPRRIALVLAAVVLTLALLSFLANVVYFYPTLTNRATRLWLRMFEMGRESSLPTWYQATALLASSGILLLIAWVKRRRDEPYVRHWAFLGAIFLFFSIDEIAMFHERVGQTLGFFFTGSGPLLYLWVIPGAIFTLIVGLSYLRFLGHLPTDIRMLVVLAGAIFVGGALGVEVVSAWYEDNHGITLTYRLLDTTEETMEKLGIVLFIYALLTYFQREVPELRVASVAAPRSAARAAPPRVQIAQQPHASSPSHGDRD
jgi:hypothetical protein